MDLQKEREAFDAYFKDKYPELHKDVFDKDGDDRAIIGYSFAWSAWQAAKAQSDKKIKLLLCDEHLQKCESPTGVFNSQYPDEEPCLICLAKEAKAKAVPNTQALHDRLLVKSIREHVESHISEISVNDLFDKGWLAAMKCIQNNIDMLEAQELAK